jgi:cytoskeletal protein CcmA (bactofilin family)
VRVGDTQMIFNSIVEFSDTANDLFVWAYMPTISGDISDNAVLGGFTVDITADAEIGGDLFIVAESSRIDGHIGGDIYAMVGDLNVSETASIDGAIYGSSAALTINGDIGGPLSYAGGVVVINATVRGDVRLECGELELGPNAVIEGELRYESAREASIDPGAQVVGDIRYSVPQDDEGDEGSTSVAAGRWISIWGLLWNGLWLLSSFLVGSIALAVGGEAARRPAKRLAQQPALGLGFGFVVAVVFPAAAILAMVLIVTLPLGLIGLAVYFAAAYLGRLIAAQTVGGWLLGAARGGKEASPYGALAIGLVLFFILTRIPYLGFLIWLAAVVAGLGGIFLATRRADQQDPAAPGGTVVPAA